MKGIIVRQPWADLILSGKKSWELRGSPCRFRGTVGIVSEGKWLGTVDVVDSLELTMETYTNGQKNHLVSLANKFRGSDLMPYIKTHAWVLKNPIRFDSPRKYVHKKGCVIWVTLSA